MHRGSIFWGVVLVLLGGILLAQNMGWLPQGLNVWAIFWSLVLVAFGISLLVRSASPRAALHAEALRLPLGDTRQARVYFHHGAGELHLDGNAAPDELLSGSFSGGVEQNVQPKPEETIVDLRVPAQNFPTLGPFDGSRGFNWTVGLNRNIPLMLDMEVGASRNWLDLRDLLVKELRLQTGASATEIDFPARAGETRAWLRSGAAAVEVRIPEGVSARIRARGGLAAFDVDVTRFPLVSGSMGSAGSEYRSPDFDMAANRVDLDVETGMGSVRIR